MVSMLWPAVAGACLMLACISIAIWMSDRTRATYLAFACFALGLVGLGVGEVLLMRAQSVEQFAHAQRWTHVPLFVVLVSTVWFVWHLLGTGRLWLAWTVCAVRLAALVANFTTGVSLNYTEVTALRQVSLWGGEPIAAATGTLNPWMILGQLGVLLLVIFVVDAAVRAARQGPRERRRQALVVAGSIVLSVLVAIALTLPVVLGITDPPYVMAPLFLLPMLAMGSEMGSDVARADRLGRALRASDAELRENKDRMDLASVAVGLGLWQWVPGHHELSMTGSGRRLFGFGDDEGVGLGRLLSRVHADDRDKVQRAIEAALASGALYEQEFRIVLPDGRLRWIASRGRVDTPSDGGGALIRVVSFDITERREVEHALAESGERFRAMADAAPVMMWMAGHDKLSTFFNRAWLDFTGRTQEEELGRRWTEGIHPDDAGDFMHHHAASIDSRRDFLLECRLRRHDGEYRWIIYSGTPRLAADGELLGYIGSCVDVTELKRAEQRMRLVFEASPNALLMVDQAGIVALANERVTAVFGYERGEVVGHHVEMLVPASLRAIHEVNRNAYHETPAKRPMATGRQLDGQRKDGSSVPLEIELSPIQSNEGRFVLVSINDISERRRTELELTHQRKELAYLSRVNLLGTLSGSLVHELNQPLTAILSNAQAGLRFLNLEPADVEEVRAILDDIVADDKRAGEVIKRLRTMFRNEELRRDRVDANEVVQDVLRMMHSEFLNRGIAVETDLAPELPNVNGDKVQLEQVLLNLVLNACEAMVDLPAHAAHVHVQTRQASGLVEVTVTDNGKGIAAADMDRVFEPFFTTKPQGMGLGLSVCRQIVQTHGGRLDVAIAERRGARFCITLPAILSEPSPVTSRL